MSLIRQLLQTIIPYKSVNIYRQYFQTIESILIYKNKNSIFKILIIIFCAIYTALLCFMLRWTSPSDQVKTIFGDSAKHLFNNNKSFYNYYIFQSALISYFYFALYLKANLSFVQHMKRIMFKNGILNGQNFIFDFLINKKVSNQQIEIFLQNVAFMAINTLQIFQLFMGKFRKIFPKIPSLKFCIYLGVHYSL